MRRLEEADPPPHLVQLAQKLGLSEYERNVLLLCVAQELNGAVGGLCAQVLNNAGAQYPTFAVASMVFDHPEWEAVLPHRPLRYFRLLEINQPEPSRCQRARCAPMSISSRSFADRVTRTARWITFLLRILRVTPDPRY